MGTLGVGASPGRPCTSTHLSISPRLVSHKGYSYKEAAIACMMETYSQSRRHPGLVTLGDLPGPPFTAVGGFVRPEADLSSRRYHRGSGKRRDQR
jgi:hypothetical protein